MNPAAAYIMEKEEPFRSIMMHLRSVMEHYVPAAELRYKWKVPYFYLEGRPFSYLNQARDYVDLGFWNSALLTAHPQHLNLYGRKLVRSLRYTSLEDIDQEVLVDVLMEASRLQEKARSS
jgi:hypothetical protein